MLVAELLATIVLVVFTSYLYFYYKRVRHMNKFSGPPTSFFGGNASDLRNINDTLHIFHDYSKKFGNGICKIRVGPIYTLIVTDYKMLEFVLSSTKIMTKSRTFEYMRRWLGSGLFIVSGELWRRHRRLYLPAFNGKILDTFMEVFNAQSYKLMEKLEKEVGKTSFEISYPITLCNLDIICETAMGVSLNTQDNARSDYVDSLNVMTNVIIKRVSSVIKSYESTYIFTKTYREENKAIKILNNTSNSVIQERRKKLDESIADDYITSHSDRKKTFLDILLQNQDTGEKLKSEEIRQEVDTFMAAGYKTTSTTVSFCVYELAQHPEIQKKVLDEQKEIFDDDIYRSITQNDLTRMKYLENVIKETLRLYPPLPYYSRKTDTDITYDGKIIPKGVSIVLFAYGIQRSADFYYDPDKFDPSRFENGSNKHPYAYIPFSAGPRICLGQKYAMMEMKVMLSHLIRHYEILPAIPEHKLILAGVVVLKSINGIKVRLEKRKLNF